ncbi:hypothetical protein [Kordia jejudonensis]|uniref:hypothetical protein n=1 Tax=Kordia jejudonensis TaxID=1348245 RepID=UPI0006296782|nr:hypothetical protein [Kordia jejudonensis]
METSKLHINNYQGFIENIIIVLSFICGANFFIFLKTIGIENPVFKFDPFREVNLLNAHLRVSIGGLLIGCVILFHEKFIHHFMNKRMSFHGKRLFWHFDTAIKIIALTFSVFIIADALERKFTFIEASQNALKFISIGLFLSFFNYYYVLSMVVSFLRRLHTSFGQHVFFNYLIDRYAEPIEEKRTFIFLDFYLKVMGVISEVEIEYVATLKLEGKLNKTKVYSLK